MSSAANVLKIVSAHFRHFISKMIFLFEFRAAILVLLSGRNNSFLTGEWWHLHLISLILFMLMVVLALIVLVVVAAVMDHAGTCLKMTVPATDFRMVAIVYMLILPIHVLFQSVFVDYHVAKVVVRFQYFDLWQFIHALLLLLFLTRFIQFLNASEDLIGLIV